jgi:ABC-type multidrug transport system ATPase subunit
MTGNALELIGLTKKFGDNFAVFNLDLEVKKGSIFGFLGANGAGKTTTIRMLMGHLHPTYGEVYSLGKNPWDHDEKMRRKIAYVSENMMLPMWMTPGDAIEFCRPLYPSWDNKLCKTLQKEFGLESKTPFKLLSKGKKRSLCILLALCQSSELLILDEPASGLDAKVRHDFLNLILDIVCSTETTVFLSSHILSDIERVVDTIAILNKGKKKLEGGLEDLKKNIRMVHFPYVAERTILDKYFTILRYEKKEKETIVLVKNYSNDKMNKFCEESDFPKSFRENGLNLEELFVECLSPGFTTDSIEIKN